MDKIEVKVLNPESITEAEKMMVAMARLTQRAEKIHNMDDFVELLGKRYTDTTVELMAELPHPTIQKFAVINIAIVGASRRFLAQITRHQNEVKFMSGSLQYSDYSGAAQFVVPYEITELDKEQPIDTGYGPYDDYRREEYLKTCNDAFHNYEMAISRGGIGNDAAGYMMPQGLRNVLLISATPYQWKHMISQRICNRNTPETQYVMLRCWEELNRYSVLFDNVGPGCMQKSGCLEGKMSCNHFLHDVTVGDYINAHDCSVPTAILDTKFKYIRGK